MIHVLRVMGIAGAVIGFAILCAWMMVFAIPHIRYIKRQRKRAHRLR